MNIAIIGLGRVGTLFIKKLISFKEKGIHIIAAAEQADTEGKKIAGEKGIPIKNYTDITGMGDHVDIIFDLTGDSEVRKTLRSGLQQNQNHHTAIAPETFAYLLWSVMEDKPLPDVHSHKGY
jgi:predicted dinucleotide-utilizing enzyme